MGLPSLFAAPAGSVVAVGIPIPPPLRPRRFSRPRRFDPLPTSWVYFTPQPRPGFTLQGFSPPHSRPISSMVRDPLVVDDRSLLQILSSPKLRLHLSAPRSIAPPSGLYSVWKSVVTEPAFNRPFDPIPSWASPPPGAPSSYRESAFTLSAARGLLPRSVESSPGATFSVPSRSPACLSRGCRPAEVLGLPFRPTFTVRYDEAR